MKTFHCKILRQNETVFSGEIRSLIAPTINGYLSILSGHEPFFGQLERGKIEIKSKDNLIIKFNIQSAGYLEVDQEKAVLYTSEIYQLEKEPPKVLWKKLPARKKAEKDNKIESVKSSLKKLINCRKYKIIPKPLLFPKSKRDPLKYLPFDKIKFLKNKISGSKKPTGNKNILKQGGDEKVFPLSLKYLKNLFFSIFRGNYNKI